MKQPVSERLHIVEGTDWQAAVIALLESRSPHRPWRYGFGEANQGDAVAIVLNTDPRTVLTAMGRIGIDGRLDRAVLKWDSPGPGLVDLDSMVMLRALGSDPRGGWQLSGKAARRFTKALTKADYLRDEHMRFGHSSVAAARILLHSQGRCSGCKRLIDLTGENAAESIRIRTVDMIEREAPEVLIKDERGARSYLELGIPTNCWRPTLPADWPGVLCTSCCSRMDDDGYVSLIDFRFSQHPKCPQCGAAKAQALQSGMPVSRDVYRDTPPWVYWRGCVSDGSKWTCTVCTREW